MVNFTYEVVRARKFAEYVHRNQKRKDGITPYFTHLERVATRVADHIEKTNLQSYAISDILAASFLHDTSEDQEVSFDLLSYLFGWNVAQYVKDLTNLPIPVGETKAAAVIRKEADNFRLANSLPGSILIKLCDRLDNLSDLAGFGPGQKKNMVDKTRKLLEKLDTSESFKQCLEIYKVEPLVAELKKIIS